MEDMDIPIALLQKRHAAIHAWTEASKVQTKREYVSAGEVYLVLADAEKEDHRRAEAYHRAAVCFQAALLFPSSLKRT